MRDRPGTARRRGRGIRIGLLATIPLLISSCLADSGVGSAVGGGTGVPAGASKQEYIAAFQDVEPITLQTQVPSNPEDPSSAHVQAYAKALKEWSGGKITMEIAYGNAIAAPDRAPAALADGRLDFDYVYPLYEPSRYPANGALANASFLGDHSPVAGTLQALGGYLELGLSTPEIMKEMESEGVKLLLPYGPTSSLGLMCGQPRNSLSEMRGAQVRVSGSAHAEQVKALGMSPVSLPYSELYQAMQRGTIDCALGSIWSYQALGVLPLAPHYTIDTDVGFARLPYGLATGSAQWESLPLVARQLMYDRLDVYIERMLEVFIWGVTKTGVREMRDSGGSVSGFEPDVEKPLAEANDKLMRQVRGNPALDGEAFAEKATNTVGKWGRIVDELGYPDIADDEFFQWYSEGKVDLQPYMQRLKFEVLTQHRPG